MKLNGKVAVITGGARGIGRAICQRFAQEGAKICVNYFSGTKGDKAQAKEVVQEIEKHGGKAIAIEADISQSPAVEKLIIETVEKFGALDILVNNAGICPFSDFLELTEELWDRVEEVNLKGAFLCSQKAAQIMKNQGRGGRILFTSSISSIFGGELQAHYCSTKGGINQLMKSIAISMGPYAITSNAVLPGTVLTNINRQQLEVDNPDLKDYFIKRSPLKKLVEPKDIAAAMAFFASDEASAITGSLLIVDAGMSVNLQ